MIYVNTRTQYALDTLNYLVFDLLKIIIKNISLK